MFAIRLTNAQMIDAPRSNMKGLLFNAVLITILQCGWSEIALQVNTARLTVVANISGNISEECKANGRVNIYSLSDECVSCDYFKISEFIYTETQQVLMDSRWPTNIKLEFKCSEDSVCNASRKYHYGERGLYQMNYSVVIQNHNHSCKINEFIIQQKPKNSNLPILYAFLILLGMHMLYLLISFIYTRNRSTSTVSLEKFINTDLGQAYNEEQSSSARETAPLCKTSSVPAPKKERLTSIDTFRGLCIVIMIFVNYGGGRYWFFTHSTWNGLTVADLVFPWFMFIMGVNIVLSIDSQLANSVPPRSILYKIFRRTVILFALGIFVINGNEAWYNMRIPGVLQRFAVSYIIVALLQLIFHVSNDKFSEYIQVYHPTDNPWWYRIRDIVLYWHQWVFMICLETVWLAITFALPVPGCPTGYLGPGGLADNGTNFNCTGGAAGYIDKVIFKKSHIYTRPTCRDIYFPMYTDEPVYYDPEGLLGTINSCLIVFIGLQAGKIFYYFKKSKERIARFLTWSILLGVVSAALTKCSTNKGVIPVNKNLWSVTFVTTLSSMAFFLISLFYIVVDVKKYWSGAPLFFVGMNSILVYVGHETYGSLPFSWGADNYSTHLEWLAMNLLGVSYWVLISYYCYKIKFFLKI